MQKCIRRTTGSYARGMARLCHVDKISSTLPQTFLLANVLFTRFSSRKKLKPEILRRQVWLDAFAETWRWTAPSWVVPFMVVFLDTKYAHLPSSTQGTCFNYQAEDKDLTSKYAAVSSIKCNPAIITRVIKSYLIMLVKSQCFVIFSCQRTFFWQGLCSHIWNQKIPQRQMWLIASV